MFIAGEASGDMRAAGLARALKTLDPSLRLSGIGGDHMRQAGVECFADITRLAVIGIAEVVKNLSRIKKVFDLTLKQIDGTHPDGVVLVDYPGFNLRLAKAIKKRGIKVIYFVSPQVWAWREKRVLMIKKCVDLMIVLFPFERSIYGKYGMKADYVGHPLVDEIIVNKDRARVLESIGLSAGKTTIGLMPGSRVKEVERHLPCMLEAARILFKQNQDRQFILLKAPTIPLKLISSVIARTGFPCHCEEPEGRRSNLFPIPCHCEEPEERRSNLFPIPCHCEESRPLVGTTKQSFIPLKIYDGPAYDGINAMDIGLVASGTATLECALLKKPMVIIYKTSWLTYWLAKSVIKVPYIGLVNIVAGKKIVEELLQNDATAGRLSDAVEAALRDGRIVDELAALKTSLGAPGASLRAARIILEKLHVNPC